jgi:hypothetical protein
MAVLNDRLYDWYELINMDMANKLIEGIDRLETSVTIKENKMFKKKLKIYYNNGRTYTATRVDNINCDKYELRYSQKKVKHSLTVSSNIAVDLVDVVAYEVFEGNKREIVRVKPSHKVVVKVEKVK